MKLRATLELSGKTATGFQIPADVVESLGSSKRPAVTVTINGHTYRSSIASMRGVYILGVSAENRAAAGVAAGDVVDLDIEVDSAPRVVAVPEDFAAALDREPPGRTAFDSLAYSHQLRHVLAIDDAKTPETRQRRIAKAVGMLTDGT
ncbi:MAG TPA: YdeI/OmpD-associated family protein [Actinopolymorphaceae bacterium]|jgi:hypothetical protein